MARTKAQIVKAIESFSGSAAKQWDSAARLTSDVCAHYWEHGDTSLIVALDTAIVDVNRNMFRAFRKVVGDCTPVVLKKDTGEEGHGTASKAKRRKLVKEGKHVAALEGLTVEQVKGGKKIVEGVGDALKAFLPEPKKAKARAKATIATKVQEALNFVDKEDAQHRADDLKAAAALIDQLKAELAAKLKEVEANLGLEGGVSPSDVDALDAAA